MRNPKFPVCLMLVNIGTTCLIIWSIYIYSVLYIICVIVFDVCAHSLPHNNDARPNLQYLLYVCAYTTLDICTPTIFTP